jgi:hypothetical protein
VPVVGLSDVPIDFVSTWKLLNRRWKKIVSGPVRPVTSVLEVLRLLLARTHYRRFPKIRNRRVGISSEGGGLSACSVCHRWGVRLGCFSCSMWLPAYFAYPSLHRPPYQVLITGIP